MHSIIQKLVNIKAKIVEWLQRGKPVAVPPPKEVPTLKKVLEYALKDITGYETHVKIDTTSSFDKVLISTVFIIDGEKVRFSEEIGLNELSSLEGRLDILIPRIFENPRLSCNNTISEVA